MKTIRMKKADWEKWDAALRSGEYEQAKHTMYNPDSGGYCCLGVLQHCLTGKVEENPDRCSTNYAKPYLGVPTAAWLVSNNIRFFDTRDSLDTLEVEEVVDNVNPLTNVRPLAGVRYSVAELNDSGRYSFEEIADAIKEAVEFTDDKE